MTVCQRCTENTGQVHPRDYQLRCLSAVPDDAGVWPNASTCTASSKRHEPGLHNLRTIPATVLSKTRSVSKNVFARLAAVVWPGLPCCRGPAADTSTSPTNQDVAAASASSPDDMDPADECRDRDVPFDDNGVRPRVPMPKEAPLSGVSLTCTGRPHPPTPTHNNDPVTPVQPQRHLPPPQAARA